MFQLYPRTNRNLSRIVAHYALRSRCRWHGSWKSPATRDSNMSADGDTSIKRTAKHPRQVHAKPILVAVLPEKLLLRLEFAVRSLVMCMGKSISVWHHIQNLLAGISICSKADKDIQMPVTESMQICLCLPVPRAFPCFRL